MYLNRMTSFPFRLMTAFLFAALVLNISNYFFVRVYNAAREKTLKTVHSSVDKGLLPPKYLEAMLNDEENTASSADNSRRDNYGEPDLTTHFPYNLMSEKIKTTTKMRMQNCPELPPDLGPKSEDRSTIAANIQYSNGKLDGIKPGGIYQPANCKSLQRVAIVIAYRGCKNYLTTFMNILHPFLMKQQLEYQIFVIEQSNKSQPYNRGKLLNVGFTEANRYRKDGFPCFIFHDPYILPTDSRNLYRCSWYPRQLAKHIERPNKEPYVPLLGGAIAVTQEQFLKFNGFSNTYWGNEADFLDLYNRIIASNYFIENNIPLIGKYKTIRKGLTLWYKSEYLSTSTSTSMYMQDGLTSLTYTVDNLELQPLFTHLQVSIDAVAKTMTAEPEPRAKMYNKLSNPATSKTTTHHTTETN